MTEGNLAVFSPSSAQLQPCYILQGGAAVNRNNRRPKDSTCSSSVCAAWHIESAFIRAVEAIKGSKGSLRTYRYTVGDPQLQWTRHITNFGVMIVVRELKKEGAQPPRCAVIPRRAH